MTFVAGGPPALNVPRDSERVSDSLLPVVAYPFAAYGKKFREKRKAASLTQAAVCKALGKSEDAISKLERGVNGTTMEAMALMADLYGCEVGDFFPRSGTWELTIADRERARRALAVLAEIVSGVPLLPEAEGCPGQEVPTAGVGTGRAVTPTAERGSQENDDDVLEVPSPEENDEGLPSHE